MPLNKKVTGIGGVFFKTNNPQQIKKWYASQLGLNCDEYGAMFISRDIDNAEKINHLQWCPFPKDTDYFRPSEKEFMINYRVENIEELVKELKASDVTILDNIVTYPYGKFVHILDPENNKIELWEPVDEVFLPKSDD